MHNMWCREVVYEENYERLKDSEEGANLFSNWLEVTKATCYENLAE